MSVLHLRLQNIVVYIIKIQFVFVNKNELYLYTSFNHKNTQIIQGELKVFP